MTNIEYIFEFANKHNFPKTDCEVIFNNNIINNGEFNIYEHDDDIVSVKFDKNLVENEIIKMEDIRFDIDSDFPEDVFFAWQKDNPEMTFKGWISLGRYIPNFIQNADYFDELDSITKDIEIKLEMMFSNIQSDDVGDSDYEDDDEDDED
jgi:hypothetical protein